MQTNKIPQDPHPTVDQEPASREASETPEASKGFAQIWESLVRHGLGESALRVGTSAVSISLFLIVVWVMGSFYLTQRSSASAANQSILDAPLPTSTAAIPTLVLDPFVAAVNYSGGITRQAELHTVIPSRPRSDVIVYTVLKGDTIFGIAEQFGLKPGSIMWGNRYTLVNPDFLSVGMQLNILPIEGAYHKWSAGEGLNGVAKFYGVKPDDIVNYPGNHLNKDTVGDYANPNIKPDTMLVIPGGHADFVVNPAAYVSRQHPAAATLGPGACANIGYGVVGTGTFIWPTTEHFLSGYDFSPAINHYAIDIAGDFGNPIYAADSGVVVFAGPSQWGYGNEIVIDHDNGFQTLYAHIMDGGIYVSCGQNVTQGATIAGMGSTGRSTGPHLHFEIHSDRTGGRGINPWDFLSK